MRNPPTNMRCLLLLLALLLSMPALAQQPQSRPSPDTSIIYKAAEVMPEFNGDISRYISDSTRYPMEARDSSQEGWPIIRFVIRRDGRVTDATVLRSSGFLSLDAEALRVVRGMPPWRPASQDGIPVNLFFTLPIRFQLDETVPVRSWGP